MCRVLIAHVRGVLVMESGGFTSSVVTRFTVKIIYLIYCRREGCGYYCALVTINIV